jgi:hypothetical protein
MATPAVPPPPGSPAPFYPLQLDLEAPDKIARWRPLVHWLLVIPHVVVLYVLVIVQRVVFVISFFAILFTGAMPDRTSGDDGHTITPEIVDELGKRARVAV